MLSPRSFYIFTHAEDPIINQSPFPLAGYAAEHAAGLDLRANFPEPVTLGMLERQLIPTGLFIAAGRL